MKAYKIQIDPYDIDISYVGNNGEEVSKSKTFYPKFELPRILCNSTIGSENGKPPKEYDLMEIGPIAHKIEHEKDIFVTLSSEELTILKSRVKFISKYFGYPHYEMFRRIMEAQSVNLVEGK